MHIVSLFVFLADASAMAADQTVCGAGNAAAAAIASGSPRVQQAMRFLADQAKQIRDRELRAQTTDAVTNPKVCIRHRVGLETAAAKDAIVQKLLASGLVSADDGATFPGGLRAGVFPPALDEGTSCPHVPASILRLFAVAPGPRATPPCVVRRKSSQIREASCAHRPYCSTHRTRLSRTASRIVRTRVVLAARGGDSQGAGGRQGGEKSRGSVAQW